MTKNVSQAVIIYCLLVLVTSSGCSMVNSLLSLPVQILDGALGILKAVPKPPPGVFL